VIISRHGNNDRLHFRAARLFENLELNFQRPRASNRARAHPEQNRIQRILLSGRVGEFDQHLAKALYRSLRNVGVVVPAYALSRRHFRRLAQLGVPVAPGHLVMPGGAVQEKPALFAQVKKAAPHQEVVARTFLVSAIRILQSGFIDCLESRHAANGLAHTFKKRGVAVCVQEPKASAHGGINPRPVGTENLFKRETGFHIN